MSMGIHLPGDPHLPPGVTERDIDPPVCCAKCGERIRNPEPRETSGGAVLCGLCWDDWWDEQPEDA